ncbi:MAG: hypothetical protein UX86_C0034G0011 [Candidatus Amesbacteria bacterium GW2011_GWC1_47_15]|uniref:Calcineurin-like phosphoesterase domain-containing protein n=2 Tax=Candidatus Amesiibacteriota TaxID=1752730 RepID=A0A0G1S0U8_9BACT|nr:MAG: hypothetical protein UX86_C0034G0011 [Candidatus Amesbacteria bacterium GW2011_GWC1_47_15]
MAVEKPKTDRKPLSRRSLLKLAGWSVLEFSGKLTPLANLSPQPDIWKHDLPDPKPHALRFLLIGDVHVGDKDNSPRQLNTQSLDMLAAVNGHLRAYPFDLLIELGDKIKESSVSGHNLSNYRACIEALQPLALPAIHLLGNHDLWGIKFPDLLNIHSRFRLNQPFGLRKFPNFQIAWLDPEIQDQGLPGSITEERIVWLRENIYKDTPTFIFTHYGFLPQGLGGNPYFNGDTRLTAYSNGPQAWKAIKDLPIPAVFNAHVHRPSYFRSGLTHMFTLPAFVENIHFSYPLNPGIYSTLEIVSPREFTVDSYYGSKCFQHTPISS